MRTLGIVQGWLGGVGGVAWKIAFKTVILNFEMLTAGTTTIREIII